MYTIAGVAVIVSGAGVIYYLSDNRKGVNDEAAAEKKRATKKERRKAKKEKDKAHLETTEAPRETGKAAPAWKYPWSHIRGRCSREKSNSGSRSLGRSPKNR